MSSAAVSTAPARSRPVRGRVGPLEAVVPAPVVLAEPVVEVPDVEPVFDAFEPLDEPLLDGPLFDAFAPLDDDASTTTVPCMNGWMVQMYAYVPALVKVCDPLWPFLRVPVSKLWSLAVAVCALGPLFVHVTVSPTWIVIVAGEKAKSEIVSDGSPAARACGLRCGEVTLADRPEVVALDDVLVVVAVAVDVALVVSAAVVDVVVVAGETAPLVVDEVVVDDEEG